MRNGLLSIVAAFAAFAVVGSLAAMGADANAPLVVSVDSAVELGSVKPVNGVGQPPMVGVFRDWSMMHYLKDAGIPYSRLHDVGGSLGGGMYVDIPNLFPDFDADENNPASYRFAFTDSLLKALDKNGVEPFFRLGVTIENWVYDGLPAQRTKPPKDFAKWGRICEHVIRHYTEGWADGLKMKITYWEIWNEAEGPSMFGAPYEEYLRLYGTVAPYLKGKFPHLKIGGPSSCGFYGGVDADYVAAAAIQPHLKYFVECARKFLAAARDNSWPLDFFSFHSYSAPPEALRQVRYADRLLDEYGFTHDKTERIFNEWLPCPTLESLGTAQQAASIAAELVALQNGPCDVACVYDARCNVGVYSPLFNPLTQKPHKAYYAFMAFNELRKRGTAIKVNAEGTHSSAPIYAAAAKGADGSVAVMLVNIDGKERPFALKWGGVRFGTATDGTDPVPSVHCRLIDATRTWKDVSLPAALPAYSVLLAELWHSKGTLKD